ncbi:hypothetical protein BDF21DRAFT_498114 [Thamnidium elegans]|nr:hypothetical protein BDF21DRAFT_498114 [Thamnidium elegans]
MLSFFLKKEQAYIYLFPLSTHFIMNVSNVKAFVWTLPNSELLSERNKHDHSNCIFTRQLDNDVAEIFSNSNIYIYIYIHIYITFLYKLITQYIHFTYKDFDGQKKTWIVDKCIRDKDIDSNPAEEERKKNIRLALKGHNTAFLFFNIGQVPLLKLYNNKGLSNILTFYTEEIFMHIQNGKSILRFRF